MNFDGTWKKAACCLSVGGLLRHEQITWRGDPRPQPSWAANGRRLEKTGNSQSLYLIPLQVQISLVLKSFSSRFFQVCHYIPIQHIQKGWANGHWRRGLDGERSGIVLQGPQLHSPWDPSTSGEKPREQQELGNKGRKRGSPFLLLHVSISLTPEHNNCKHYEINLFPHTIHSAINAQLSYFTGRPMWLSESLTEERILRMH